MFSTLKDDSAAVIHFTSPCTLIINSIYLFNCFAYFSNFISAYLNDSPPTRFYHLSIQIYRQRACGTTASPLSVKIYIIICLKINLQIELFSIH